MQFEKFSRRIFPLKVPRTYLLCQENLNLFFLLQKNIEHWVRMENSGFYFSSCLYLSLSKRLWHCIAGVKKFGSTLCYYGPKRRTAAPRRAAAVNMHCQPPPVMLTDRLPIPENSHISFHSHLAPLFSWRSPSRHFSGRNARKKRNASCEARWKVNWTRNTVALWSLCRSPSITTGLFCWRRKCCSAAFE